MLDVAAPAVTVTTSEFDVHPFNPVNTAEYVPGVVTVIDCVVALLLHAYVLFGCAEITKDSPGQRTLLPFKINDPEGTSFTFTITSAASEHPFAAYAVTTYVPPCVAIIDELLRLEFQMYVLPPVPVNTTDPPSQNVVAPPAVIPAVGTGKIVTGMFVDVEVHPKTFVTVTL